MSETDGPEHRTEHADPQQRHEEPAPQSEGGPGPLGVPVAGLIDGTGIQAKLTVGAAGDPYEQEADRIAHQVVHRLRTGTPRRHDGDGVQRAPADLISLRRQPRVGAAGGDVDATTESRIRQASAGGTRLPEAVRSTMETAFGADFSGVRVHTGSVARDLNEDLSARAFTLGRDVYFRDGLPNAQSAAGQELLAHELAHTIQQGGAVARSVIQRDGEEIEPEAESETESESESESGEAVSSGRIEGEEEETEEGHTTAPPAGMPMDGGERPSGRRTKGPRVPTATGPMVFSLDSTAIGLETSIQESSFDATARMADAVESKVGTESKTTPGYKADPFGIMSPSFSVKDRLYNVDATKKTVSLGMTIKLNARWGVNAAGRTDIASGASSKITAKNYQEIVSDLTPKLEEQCWRADRFKFWSKDICARHEQYHATDYRNWLAGTGKDYLKDYLDKKTIALTDKERGDRKKLAAKVKPIYKDALDTIEQQAWLYYSGGDATSYTMRPGEIRAFGDGKVPYEQLAAAVKQRGEALEKEKADKGKKGGK
jgi:hypothetical protein